MRTHKSLVALGSAVVLSACSVGAFSPAYAATGAPGPLTLTAQGSNTAGGTVTLTAKESASTPLWYQWWVQEPNGQWKQVQEGSQSTYQLTNLAAGSYLVAVDTLTTAQAQSHDWSAEQKAEQTINVGTTVAVTNITGALTSTGVTAGQPVTVTAQATNITNPQYQFWIKQNGTWTGTAYTDSPTYTFTPTTANFEVAVYAKTVLEPNNGGSGVGLTTTTASTPQMWALNTGNAQAEHQILSIINGYAPFHGSTDTDGVATPALVGAPSATVIDPLIPTNLPPNGTVTGAAALLAAHPNLVSQAQAIVQAEGVTITPQLLEAGMHLAAQDLMVYRGNDPVATAMLMAPDELPPDNTTGQVWPMVQSILNNYIGKYSVSLTHNYFYYQSAVIEPTTDYDTVSVAAPQSATIANLPPRLLVLSLPMTITQIANYQDTGNADNVENVQMQATANVALYPDPLVKGGVEWGFDGWNATIISSPIIWPAS